MGSDIAGGEVLKLEIQGDVGLVCFRLLTLLCVE